MPRYIDADELLKDEHQHYDYLSDEYYIRVRDVEDAPTIEERKKQGHWDMVQQGRWLYAKCSECGTISDARTPYCAYCGARMERGDN